MSEKSPLEVMLEKVDHQVSQRVDEKAAEMESKFDQKYGAAVHTESRTSKWVDHDPTKDGSAFREFVGAKIRAYNNGSKDPKSHTDPEFAKRYIDPFEKRSPIATNTDGGSNVLENPLFETILALLRTEPVLERLGIRIVPMESDTLDLPIESQKTSFAYTDEGSQIAESKFDWEKKTLTKKGLKGRVEVTRDFLESNPRAAEDYVATKIVEDFVDAMHNAVVHGMMGGPQPLFDGISEDNKLELISPQNENDVEKKIDALVEAVRGRDVNVRRDRVKFLSSIKGRNVLKNLRDDGERLYKGLLEQGMNLDGYEFVESGYVADDYEDSEASAGDEWRIFGGDFSAYWMGILTDMRLDYDESEFFSKDIVQWKLVGQHDGKVAFPDRLAVLSTNIG